MLALVLCCVPYMVHGLFTIAGGVVGSSVSKKYRDLYKNAQKQIAELQVIAARLAELNQKETLSNIEKDEKEAITMHLNRLMAEHQMLSTNQDLLLEALTDKKNRFHRIQKSIVVTSITIGVIIDALLCAAACGGGIAGCICHREKILPTIKDWLPKFK